MALYAPHSNPIYLVNHASNVSFSADWIDVEPGKVLWLAFTNVTAVTGTFILTGTFGHGTTPTFTLTLPSDLPVHKSSGATGTAVVSGNTITLTAFVGTFAIALLDAPPQVRPDYTANASPGGAAAGANGFQGQFFQRAA